MNEFHTNIQAICSFANVLTIHIAMHILTFLLIISSNNGCPRTIKAQSHDESKDTNL